MTDATLAHVRDELRRADLDAWLIYDFRGTNPIARRVLDLDAGLLSRRIFALVPREGVPRLLVSRLEIGSLRAPAFNVRAYGGRAELERELRALLPAGGRVAMEFSPRADLPYVSHVDAGTVQWLGALLAETGGTLHGSADLLQSFAAWTPAQVAAHREAADAVMEVLEGAWAAIDARLAAGETVRETEVQAHVADAFDARGLTYAHRAIVGFGPNGGDPHYVPRPGEDRALAPGDPILIDLFARRPEAGAPYADVTWMGVYGAPDPAFVAAWEAVRDAREVGVATLRAAFAEGRPIQGWEVDRAVRTHLTDAGFGEAFVHRTGHSLGSEHTHGDAVHFDDFETFDTREVRPDLGLTIEPGVYLPAFGVRSELDVLITDAGVEVTTGRQTDLRVVGG
ncbi:MAG: M24 family metallopeptidase [Trueperaceae bacterium]|nr:M24 family metallopeptidase [Trueperaceae bacterium]